MIQLFLDMMISNHTQSVIRGPKDVMFATVDRSADRSSNRCCRRKPQRPSWWDSAAGGAENAADTASLADSTSPLLDALFVVLGDRDSGIVFSLASGRGSQSLLCTER
jgi:hypothetical protein